MRNKKPESTESAYVYLTSANSHPYRKLELFGEFEAFARVSRQSKDKRQQLQLSEKKLTRMPTSNAHSRETRSGKKEV